jgi:hypothetical protein
MQMWTTSRDRRERANIGLPIDFRERGATDQRHRVSLIHCPDIVAGRRCDQEESHAVVLRGRGPAGRSPGRCCFRGVGSDRSSPGRYADLARGTRRLGAVFHGASRSPRYSRSASTATTGGCSDSGGCTGGSDRILYTMRRTVSSRPVGHGWQSADVWGVPSTGSSRGTRGPGASCSRRDRILHTVRRTIPDDAIVDGGKSPGMRRMPSGLITTTRITTTRITTTRITTTRATATLVTATLVTATQCRESRVVSSGTGYSSRTTADPVRYAGRRRLRDLGEPRDRLHHRPVLGRYRDGHPWRHRHYAVWIHDWAGFAW